MTTMLNKPTSLPDDVKREITEAFGFVPSFFLTLPQNETRLFWRAIKDFQMSDKTALSGKVKELIGLGVASQIPCHYCVVFHTEAARLNGATEQEIQEAIFMAGVTRMGSTILNGSQIDQATFDKEVRDIVAYAKKQQGASAPRM
jgi:AhpD family alkylhydroperoxidase